METVGSFLSQCWQAATALDAMLVSSMSRLSLMGTTLFWSALLGTLLMTVNNILKVPTPDLPLTDLAILLLYVQKSQLSCNSLIKVYPAEL